MLIVLPTCTDAWVFLFWPVKRYIYGLFSSCLSFLTYIADIYFLPSFDRYTYLHLSIGLDLILWISHLLFIAINPLTKALSLFVLSHWQTRLLEHRALDISKKYHCKSIAREKLTVQRHLRAAVSLPYTSAGWQNFRRAARRSVSATLTNSTHLCPLIPRKK